MAVLTLSPADLERQTRLRRAKAFATGLLLVSAVVFLAVRSAAADGATWAGYDRARQRGRDLCRAAEDRTAAQTYLHEY